MKNEWDDYAEMWDSVASEYADKAFNELNKHINIKELRVLDFGCGTGLLSERMAPYCKEIVALDNSPKMIDILRKKNLPSVTVISELLTADLINHTSVLQKPFDLIVASSVCAFLPNYRETVQLLTALLKNGGMFIQWDWLKERSETKDGLSKEEVQKVLSKCGLNDVTISVPFEMSSPGGIMPVLMGSGVK